MATKNVQSSRKIDKSERRKSKTNKICKGVFMNFILSVYFLLRLYFDKLIDYLFGLYWNEHRTPVPDLEEKHYNLSLSAVALAEKIRKKELKSVDLVTACIERIKQVNPILNAVTDERYEEALEEAREVDEKIANGLSEEDFKKQPFLGVPFTAKESHAVKGMLHTLGVISRRNERAQYDAECVRLLRAAGALPVAVTNVPEINKWQETRNMLFGQTNNPYHSGRTVGGSSGGEAALSAALASPISLCSDIGGSTRMPAYFCGLFGYNPTAGHTSLKGSALRSGVAPTMASIGFVSKHSEDLAPLTAVVAAEHAHGLGLDMDVDVQTLKFYYVDSVKDLRISPLDSDIKQTINKVVSLVRQQAPTVEVERYGHAALAQCYGAWRYHMALEDEDFAALLTNGSGRACGLVELAKKMVGRSEYTLAAVLKLLDAQLLAAPAPHAADLAADLARDLQEKLGTNGVLIFPSAPSAAPPHYAAYLRPYNFALWGVFNAIKFPAVQVPIGVNSDGLPLGVQIVSAPRADGVALAAARFIEQHFGGYTPPCKLK